MPINTEKEAIMLLTVSLAGGGSKSVSPLSAREWAKFEQWLLASEITPAALMNEKLETLLQNWDDPKISILRLKLLLNRSAALGLSLEKWMRSGIWIIVKTDPEYPEKIRRRLEKNAPPVLFGYGNKKLLNKGGIAVVSSRDASDEDIGYSVKLGAQISNGGYSVVTGGAYEVEQGVITSALKASGTAIVFFGGKLLDAGSSSKYRKHILNKDLVLVSTFNPETNASLKNVMALNSCIYGASDAAIVIHSLPNKGRVWTGAIEGLDKDWLPIWVKDSSEDSGNGLLQSRGANWIPKKYKMVDFLKQPLKKPQMLHKSIIENDSLNIEEQTKGVISLYDCFILHLENITAASSLDAKDIANELKASKSQVNLWLKRGVDEGKIEKHKKPVRYKYQPRLI